MYVCMYVCMYVSKYVCMHSLQAVRFGIAYNYWLQPP